MISVLLAASLISSNSIPVDDNMERIVGHWKGIEKFQDENSYDGRTFYLPNREELIIDKNKVKIYFYPYFKSDEFETALSSKSIVYSIGRKRVRSEYSFKGDTLVLTMNFINKNFIKMYVRSSFDEETIRELDAYGFNPSSMSHEFELDTLHSELRKGFVSYADLSFKPFERLQFISDELLRINREDPISFERGYQSIRYLYNGVEGEFRIYMVQGTQQLSIIPFSFCNCDNIILPYIVVSWAARVRKKVESDRY